MRVASTAACPCLALTLQPGWLVGWAALSDVCALLLVASDPRAHVEVAALLLHFAGVVPLALSKPLTGSWRLLAVALCATLPGAGAAAAALLLRAGDGGALDLVRPPPALPEGPPVPPPSWKRPLRARLTSKDRSERTAALGELVRRGDAPALEVLRSALARGNGETALEAALAVEEVSARAEHRLSTARATYRKTPSRASATELLDALVAILEMELAEGELRHRLLAEAEMVAASGWVNRVPAQCRLAWAGRRARMVPTRASPAPGAAAPAGLSRDAA